MKVFTDADLTKEVDSGNNVVIGRAVYNEIYGDVPSNLNYVVTDCTAKNSQNDPTSTYNIIAVSHFTL